MIVAAEENAEAVEVIKMSHVIEVRGNKYFVCEYTGVFMKQRYYIPVGKNRTRCFVTLPVMLRAIEEQFGWDERVRVKALCEEYYHQPDIPMQPSVDIDRVPMSNDDAVRYLDEISGGQSWIFVAGAEHIDDYTAPPKPRKKRSFSPPARKDEMPKNARTAPVHRQEPYTGQFVLSKASIKESEDWWHVVHHCSSAWEAEDLCNSFQEKGIRATCLKLGKVRNDILRWKVISE